MEPDDADPNNADSERYPAAPVPAHERPWRHPSEVGHAAWVGSEPPLAIGRGLTIATGTIGCLLAVALLWAVLPTRAGGAGVAAGSTEALPPIELPPIALTVPTTDTSTVTSVDDTAGTTDRQALLQIVEARTTDPNPLAVVIGDGSLAVTTARAIVDGSGRDQGVSIVVPSGGSTRVRVLLIDPVHGIAVLESDTTGSALPVARSIRAGETLRVVGERRSTTVVASDGSITLGYPVSAMREGTPLVNERGELVALITRRGGTVHLVELVGLTIFDELVATRDTLASGDTLPAP